MRVCSKCLECEEFLHCKDEDQCKHNPEYTRFLVSSQFEYRPVN